VFGLEYSPGLLGSLQPVLESVGLGDFWFVFSYFLEHSVPRGLRKVACYRLFSQIEHMHKHERLFEEECKNMKAKDAHNTTALKHHISYLEGLSPNFASLEYASLDANGRFLCFIGLHRAENESACYQRILDKRLAELREKLHWANRASAVCAEIGVKL
jgi:hypothetical protein